MALVPNPSDGGAEPPLRRVRVEEVTSLISEIRQIPVPSRTRAPPHPRQQHPKKTHPESQRNQTTRAPPNVDDSFHPEAASRYRRNRRNNKTSVEDLVNVSPNSANAFPESTNPARQQTLDRNVRTVGDNNINQPSDRPSSNKNANKHWTRRNGNQGARRSNQQSKTGNNADHLPIDPATGQPISKRAAKRRRARERKAAAREAGTQQGAAHNAARAGQPHYQSQFSPSLTFSEYSNSIATTSYRRRQAEQTVGPPMTGHAINTSAAARETETQRQGATQNTARIDQNQTRTQTQTSHPPSSSKPAPTSWQSLLRAKQTIDTPVARHPAAPSTNTAPRWGSGRPPPLGTNTRPPAASIIADTSNFSLSGSDDSENGANSAPGIGGRYSRTVADNLQTPQRHTQPESRPRRSASSPCSICLDIPDEFPNHRPTSRCIHASTICAPCLEQHISYAVQSQGSTTLTCPDPECRQTMEYADVVRGTRNNRACLDRYETLLLRRTLEKESNFRWCKSPACDYGQIHESGAIAPMIICQACRARSCFTHDITWHTGLTCEQYTAARRAKWAGEDRASQTYIELHAKKCPNPSCRRRIEKSEGCDHMTCRRPAGCGHQFCWICLADYEPIRREGNHRHATTCPHYAPLDNQDSFLTYLRRAEEELERARQDRPPRVNNPVPANARHVRRPSPARPARVAPAPTQSWWGWLFGW